MKNQIEFFDFKFQKRIIKKAKQALFLLHVLNIITFRIFENRLNYQAEKIVLLVVKSFKL